MEVLVDDKTGMTSGLGTKMETRYAMLPARDGSKSPNEDADAAASSDEYITVPETVEHQEQVVRNCIKEANGTTFLEEQQIKELYLILRSMNLPSDIYLKLLVQDGFDNPQAFTLIEEHDLERIGITKRGHRRKIMHYVETNRPKFFRAIFGTC